VTIRELGQRKEKEKVRYDRPGRLAQNRPWFQTARISAVRDEVSVMVRVERRTCRCLDSIGTPIQTVMMVAPPRSALAPTVIDIALNVVRTAVRTAVYTLCSVSQVE
jgi:hypothetical protein